MSNTNNESIENRKTVARQEIASIDKTKKLALAGILLALSLLGANLKLFGDSIAFDSAPAFLAALLLGPTYGAFLGASGHLLSAAFAAFPLGMPVHLITATSMAIIMAAHGYIKIQLSDKIVAIAIRIIIALLMNVFIATLPLVPLLGCPLVQALWIKLLIAAVPNVLLAELIYFIVKKNNLLKIQSNNID